MSGSCDTWHLYWQAAKGLSFVETPALRLRLRFRLIDAHGEAASVLLSYHLSPAEIHVLSELPAGTSPNELARRIGPMVAKWLRKRPCSTGQVFARPCQLARIASAEALLREFWMLAWRPVISNRCRLPSHDPHSAVRIALGLTTAGGYNCGPLLAKFGDSVRAARAEMRSFLARRPTDREAMEWELARCLVQAKGTVGPRESAGRYLPDGEAATLVAAGGDGIDGALRLLEAWTVTRLGLPPGDGLRQASDADSVRARAIVACVAVDRRLCSAASVARYFGRSKPTLCEQMSSFRRSHADRDLVRTDARRIVEEAIGVQGVTKERLSSQRLPAVHPLRWLESNALVDSRSERRLSGTAMVTTGEQPLDQPVGKADP